MSDAPKRVYTVRLPLSLARLARAYGGGDFSAGIVALIAKYAKKWNGHERRGKEKE